MQISTINNIAWRFLQTFGKQGVIFVMFLISAKYLSPLDFSTYTYIFVLINLFVLFCDFGISSAVSKFSADYIIKSDSKLYNIIPTFTFFIAGATIAITLVITLFGKILFTQDEYLYLLVSSILIFFIPMIGIYDGIYRGSKNFKKLSLINVGTGIIGIIVFLYCIQNWGLLGAFIGQIIYNATLYISLLLASPIKSIWKFHREVFFTFSKYAVYIGVATIGYALFVKADIITMRYFGYIIEIGHYELIMRFLDILILPFILVGQVIGPNQNNLFLEKKHNKIQRNMLRESGIIGGIGIIIVVGIYLISNIFFSTFFEGYDISLIGTIVLILLISIPLRFIAAYTTQAYITPSGNFKQTTYSIVVFGILNVISNIIFTPIYGVNAIFISTTLFLVLYLVCKDILFLYFLKK